MGIGPLVNLASGYIQSLFTGPINGSSSNTPSSNTTGSTGATGSVPDSNRLSPFAQILGSLQQLQQSNPSQYQQVTQQIAGKLQTASQTASADGNTGLAGELTQLSTDFKNASTSGQLPNVQDLAQAVGGGGHHHHHHGGGSGAGSADSTSAASNLSTYLQSLGTSQNGAGASTALNPISIIYNTLAGAGVAGFSASPDSVTAA